MTSRGDINFSWARQLVGALAGAGITRAVISPGSRSTPLTLSALRQPGLRCDVIPDERSAAFFALGLAKASGNPALLIATSGTAVANWLPAVAEANMAGVPMLLLSADRPPELHDCGARGAGRPGTRGRAPLSAHVHGVAADVRPAVVQVDPGHQPHQHQQQ